MSIREKIVQELLKTDCTNGLSRWYWLRTWEYAPPWGLGFNSLQYQFM